MPIRKMPLVSGEIYHIFNRGVGAIPIFKHSRNYDFLLETLKYYQRQADLRYSYFLRLPREQRDDFLAAQKANPLLVEVLCYCLMPNHFHLLVRQLVDDGIITWMRKSLNSYSTSFNRVAKRYGSLFQGTFRAVRVETDEQLLHVSRYIHINPSVGFVVKRSQLLDYPWSSLATYLGREKDTFVNPALVLSHFPNVSAYREFVLNEADYKRKQKEFAFLSLE